ncbi:type 1 glutamine amidotransferase [Nocardioides agariphilus]|jgi:GMP synthase (glutamine-hydrolysing)|uniref:Type 1 glutamine amidotransferase n=1 Tax=Nocardioides agariphilus TaxID=433664 RepID=A0A930YL84_9ACTN|nr:type 1 glutamine amidotransferase [Nocardioides agariphilus]MBF4766814.1 type 1 glutamine amidotransferase [Nocardioides agariphilus]
MTARIAVIQHEATCPPHLVGTWLADAGASVSVCHPYAGDELPDPSTYDALVVLGGSMGANDDATSPWLAPVRERIRQHAEDGVPVLGICLGHQLAAVALGGTVEVNSRGQTFGLRNLGWTPDAHLDPLMSTVATPRRGVHWHDDIVTSLPEGAVVLASAEGVEVQAARFAPTVWGVQHHPEVDAELIRPWAKDDRELHLAQGLDAEAVLDEIDSARDELEAAWRPLAERFVEVTEHHRV